MAGKRTDRYQRMPAEPSEQIVDVDEVPTTTVRPSITSTSRAKSFDEVAASGDASFAHESGLRTGRPEEDG